MLRPSCSLTPTVPPSMSQGVVATVQVSVSSLGLRAAMQGQVTLGVPAGLGTIQGSATQSFNTPLNPSDGFKGTSYSASATGGILAVPLVPTYFEQYGFSTVSNATNFVVDNVSTSPPAGTGAPPSGLLGFVYLRMDGTLPPGSRVAFANMTYSKAKAQQLGLNATTLAFYRWNNATSQWQEIPTVFTDLNSTHGFITIYLTGFSYFAVFASLVPTGGGMGNTLLLIVGVAAIVIVVVVAVLVLKKRKSGPQHPYPWSAGTPPPNLLFLTWPLLVCLLRFLRSFICHIIVVVVVAIALVMALVMMRGRGSGRRRSK